MRSAPGGCSGNVPALTAKPEGPCLWLKKGVPKTPKDKHPSSPRLAIEQRLLVCALERSPIEPGEFRNIVHAARATAHTSVVTYRQRVLAPRTMKGRQDLAISSKQHDQRGVSSKSSRRQEVWVCPSGAAFAWNAIFLFSPDRFREAASSMTRCRDLELVP